MDFNQKELPVNDDVYLAFFNTPNDKFVETVFFYQGKFVSPGRSKVEFITQWMYILAFPPDKQDES